MRLGAGRSEEKEEEEETAFHSPGEASAHDTYLLTIPSRCTRLVCLTFLAQGTEYVLCMYSDGVFSLVTSVLPNFLPKLSVFN